MNAPRYGTAGARGGPGWKSAEKIFASAHLFLSVGEGWFRTVRTMRWIPIRVYSGSVAAAFPQLKLK